MNYFEEINKIPDFELMGHVFELMATYRNKSELHQFHAAKAFAGYMDQSIAKERQNAEEKLLEKV